VEKELGRPASEEEIAAALEMGLDEFWEFLQQAKGASFISIEDLGPYQDADQEIKISLADPEGQSPLSQLLSEDTKKVLGRAIDQLPEKEKLVISLYYYEELTMKEIGKVLKITESRVSQLHTQALFRLKAKLHEWNEHKT
jgi:RNA polymerase sigma factor for flagellar operon FliA